jgi:UPF0716 protein FxsA
VVDTATGRICPGASTNAAHLTGGAAGEREGLHLEPSSVTPPVTRMRRLTAEMFVFVLIGVPVVEVLAFIEVGRAIGWLLAVVLLFGTSLLGVRVLRAQGRSAIERVSLAVSERDAPGRAAIDGALGFLGGLLLVVPGFVTDVFGVLLLFKPTRTVTRRWLSRRIATRVMRFTATAGRFAPRTRGVRVADVESTAIEEDPDQLGR